MDNSIFVQWVILRDSSLVHMLLGSEGDKVYVVEK